MRLLCPFCQKAITVPDSDAGKAVNCPECAQQFAAPQLFTPGPTVEPAAEKAAFPVPPSVPETYMPEPISSSESVTKSSRLPDIPAPDREMSGYGAMKSIPLDPQIVRFVPAAALFLLFVLTFFSWNGLFPGGYSAFTQNAWYGLVGSMSRDKVADDALTTNGEEGGPKIGDEIDKRLHGSLWLLPFLLFLLPALALAFAGPIVEFLKIKIPPGVANLWTYRPALLSALTLMMFFAVAAQWASGFGLDKAVSQMVEERHADQKAKANTPEKLQRWEMKMDAERGMYHVRTTFWLRLAMLAIIVALLSAAAETFLKLRGNKPAPRVGVMW